MPGHPVKYRGHRFGIRPCFQLVGLGHDHRVVGFDKGFRSQVGGWVLQWQHIRRFTEQQIRLNVNDPSSVGWEIIESEMENLISKLINDDVMVRRR